MDIGDYRINFDALLARLIYRWRYHTLAGLALLLTLGGVVSDTVPPFWRGRAVLSIIAAPGASILVDGRTWPQPLYAGAHQLEASMPDGRRAWADITLRSGTPLTVTLPAGLPEPRERALPPAAPGTHLEHIWWADSAWRVVSAPDQPTNQPDSERQSATPTIEPQSGQTVAVEARSVERLSTLDAYAGLADQVHVGDQLREAVYRPIASGSYGEQAPGTIEVHGWSGMQTLPISAPLTLLRFAPDGKTLLWAEQIASDGEQIYIAHANGARKPVVAVPGRIVRLAWQPDSHAVVLHSMQGERLTLTLIRLAPTIVAAAIADLPAARYADALVPLSWDDDGLLWVAPDDAGDILWRAPLSTLIPERGGALDARVIARLADGTLRVVVIQGQQVVIGRYQDGIVIGETSAAHVPPAADLAGAFAGDALLLEGDGRAWLLDLDTQEH